MTSRNPPIRITEVDVVRSGNVDRLRASVDGNEIWYAFDSALGIEPRLEPFLPTAILLGMADGRDVIADGSAPVSPKLLKATETLRRIVRQWNPESHHIDIEAHTEPPIARAGMVASTFSGGVDSMCTLVRRSEITHLVFMSGFDRRSSDAWPDVEREWKKRISDLGKVPVTINTNVMHLTEELGISSHYSSGSVLAATLATLAPRTGYVPSSHTYRELKPWGSHPLVDILWSTEATEIIHDSQDLTRAEKTGLVASDAERLRQLQVCWYARTENCGKCSKCIRTMLTLKVLGLGRGPFPDIDVTAHIEALKPGSPGIAGMCWDIMKHAERNGHHEIAARLEKLLRWYKIDRDARSLVKNIVGKSAITRFNRWRGKPWVDMKLPTRDPDDFD